MNKYASVLLENRIRAKHTFIGWELATKPKPLTAEKRRGAPRQQRLTASA
jgi:hypothetical protein